MIKKFGYDILEEFFEHDTYGNLLDLLLAMVNGKYTIESLRLDIEEWADKVGGWGLINKIQNFNYLR